MFLKKRSRWAMKRKNRIGQHSISRYGKRSCEPPSEFQNESVASKKENGGDILKQTIYGKLFQATMLLLEDYCANSTLHGVRYFLDKKRHWLERFWWIAGFVTSIFCCGALIHKVYNNWDERSIIVSISEELTPVWDIPLPAITICPSNKIPSKEIKLTDIYDRWKERQPDIPFNITDEEVKIALAYNIVCTPSQDFFNISHNFSVNSVLDVVWKLSPSLNYTVRDCVVFGYSLGDSDVFQCNLEEIMIEQGLCFTFNMLNGKETYSNESTHYSQMDHNKTAQWNLENGYDPNISSNSRAYPYRVAGAFGGDILRIPLFLSKEHHMRCQLLEGFQFALHVPGEIPQHFQFKFSLHTFENAFIIVKPKVIKTSEGLRPYHPDRRKCYFNEDRKLRFLNVYTQQNCELECLSNFTLSLCGCVQHFMLRDANTPICRPAKYRCYDSARQKLLNGKIKPGLIITEEENIRLNKLVENCNCLPPCNSINYDAEIRKINLNLDRNDMDQRSLLEITFEESKFMTLTRSEVYGTIDFIASCGGLLGLFVGASFLSVVELLYYCTLRLYCTRRNRKNEMAISN